MRQLINRFYSNTSRHRGILIYGYGILLLCPPLYHLIDKLSNDSGGPASRYLPLLTGLILMAGHRLYIKRKPLHYRLFWRIFLSAYWVAISLLMLFFVFLMFINGINTLASVVTGTVWAAMTIPAALSISRYINQQK